MVKHWLTALAGAGVLAATGWAQDTEDAAAPAEPVIALETAAPIDVICPFGFDYEPGEITCGFISVPENRSDPDSRMIRLHYVKLASIAEDEAEIRPDPVIYLTGGPGVTVEGYADRLREHAILEQRDLYILEQRGIGNSSSFCPQFANVRRDLAWGDTPLDDAANQAERMRTCFQSATAAGMDLRGYNTWENAQDVRALREALGFETWNVWGISYGSHLGQMLLQADPDGTRALVLDAIVPNDIVDLMRIGRWVDRILDNVFETCAGDAVCDGLPPRYMAAIEALKADPVLIEVDNPEVFPEGQVRFGAEILLFAPFMMMYEQDEHPAIPAVMNALTTAVERGDNTLFELLASDDGDDGGISVAQGMASAIRCNDGYFAASAHVVAEDLAENPLFQDMGFSAEGAALQAQVCVDEGLTARADHPERYALVQSDVPTLVVNGAWDPVTPPPLAERILAGLSRSRYIEVPFTGHGPTRSMSECAGPVLNAFFDDPDPAALDATCLEEGIEEPSYVSLYPTTALIRAGVMATDDPKTLAPAALWAGLPIFILLIGLFIYPFSLVARLIDGQPVQSLSGDTGGARLPAFATAVTGVAFPALLGIGGAQLADISQIALMAGLTEIAGIGAWMGLATGIFGLLTLLMLWRTQFSEGRIRIGTLTGMTLTGLSGIALAAFAFSWDLSPF